MNRRLRTMEVRVYGELINLITVGIDYPLIHRYFSQKNMVVKRYLHHDNECLSVSLSFVEQHSEVVDLSGL